MAKPAPPANLSRLRSEVALQREEVAKLRARMPEAMWLLRMESRLMREALDAASTVSLGGHEPGYNQNRDRRGRWAPGFTVENSSPAYRVRIHQLVGRKLSDGEVGRLAGAHAGDHVTVGPGMVTVHRAGGSGYHTVSIVPGDGPHARPQMVTWANRDAAGHEIEASAHVLATQVRAARRLGFERISTQARPGTNDYERLPRLGYNASLKAALHESRLTTAGMKPTAPLPRSARGARTLSDLLSTKEGAAWWHANGLNPFLHLDVARGSQSAKTLARYLRAHGGEEQQP